MVPYQCLVGVLVVRRHELRILLVCNLPEPPTLKGSLDTCKYESMLQKGLPFIYTLLGCFSKYLLGFHSVFSLVNIIFYVGHIYSVDLGSF